MSKTAEDFNGVDIREVWDFRLSKACPYLFNSGEFWVIRLIGNNGEGVLEEIETDIPTATTTIEEGQRQCYPILYAIRDNYSRDHIEERKPVVAIINDANRVAQEINAAKVSAETSGDVEGALELAGKLQAHLAKANSVIAAATANLQHQIANGGE